MEFDFDFEKARRALGQIGEGSTKVLGNITPVSTGTVPGFGITTNKAKPAVIVKESERRRRTDESYKEEILDLKKEIKGLKARVSKLELDIFWPK